MIKLTKKMFRVVTRDDGYSIYVKDRKFVDHNGPRKSTLHYYAMAERQIDTYFKKGLAPTIKEKFERVLGTEIENIEFKQ